MFTDPYLLPGSTVLRNRLGITVRPALDAAEADLFIARHIILAERPMTPTFDFPHLLAIHLALFADLYDWAGEPRTVDLSLGGNYFMPAATIRAGAMNAFAALAAEDHLRGLTRDEFIERLARHYDNVNYLHPFREGNGRSSRVFWGQLAAAAGHPIDWRRTTREANNGASRRAMVDGNFTPLGELLERVVA